MRKVYLEDFARKGTLLDVLGSVGRDIRFVYDDITGTIRILEHVDNFNIRVQYADYEPQTINTDNFKKARLAKVLGMVTAEFRFSLGQHIKDSRRDLTILEQTYQICTNGTVRRKSYRYLCNDCHQEHSMTETDLRGGHGCPCRSRTSCVPGINDIMTLEPWMAQFFQGGLEEAMEYTPHSNKAIYPVCPECGRIKKTAIKISGIYSNHSIGCSCGDGLSYGEKYLRCLLEQLGVVYVHEMSNKTAEWCGQYRYDFYLPDVDCIIEVNGGQHYGDRWRYRSGRHRSYEQEVMNDAAKKNLAKQHGIRDYIIIDASHSDPSWMRKSILEGHGGRLTSLLGFTEHDIDWATCHDYATHNLVKAVCVYYNEHEGMTTRMVGEVFRLHYSTVSNYLKQGTVLGWCSYDASQSCVRESRHAYRCRMQPLMVQADDGRYMAFESSVELISRSQDVMEAKIDRTKLYKHIDKDSCCGYTIRRISQEEFNAIKREEAGRAYGDFFDI